MAGCSVEMRLPMREIQRGSPFWSKASIIGYLMPISK